MRQWWKREEEFHHKNNKGETMERVRCEWEAEGRYENEDEDVGQKE